MVGTVSAVDTSREPHHIDFLQEERIVTENLQICENAHIKFPLAFSV